ncbi:SAM hydrolase/SAM-dependent halogenase family protein [Halorientalis marina]|uniref:SAM hydrolase/SAM-dependent halogenase family protein n=1 Tax=Halorientalis marina TaxID=2931976 RepID=UPI001FF2C62D|nr:SAM-dependent chlorinase/fluorinase [Halorientalis marina]
MITLSSDFGSPYPAAMKGVLLSATDAQLVDVSHDFPRQDVRAAAFWLREVLPYFPPAVHLAVVDPGVGTDRAAVAIRAGDHALVGPDNGVLVPVARELADGSFEVFRIDADDPESSTFHGRDVFAPAAAAVHEAGVDAFHERERFAPADDVVELTFPEATVTDGSATGEVLVVDDFGNTITNVPGTVLDGRFGGEVTVDGESAPARRTYAAVDPGQRLVTVGSHGNVELAVNHGRGDDAFGLEPGDAVELSV